jgi:hypothetical protein
MWINHLVDALTRQGFCFYILNKDKFKEDIEEVFYDCVLQKYKMNRTKNTIAKQGSCGNWGPNLGYAGEQSNEHGIKTKVMKPTKAAGTQCYTLAA